MIENIGKKILHVRYRDSFECFISSTKIFKSSPEEEYDIPRDREIFGKW